MVPLRRVKTEFVTSGGDVEEGERNCPPVSVSNAAPHTIPNPWSKLLIKEVLQLAA